MADRRQADRREGSKKKLSMNFSNFIMICIMFVIVVVSIILCFVFYNKGYTDGSNYGYSEGHYDGLSEGFDQGFYSLLEDDNGYLSSDYENEETDFENDIDLDYDSTIE